MANFPKYKKVSKLEYGNTRTDNKTTLQCKICGAITDELWADTYCQECWETYCDEEYNKEIKKLPPWCFEKE